MACIFKSKSTLEMAAYFLYNVALEDGFLCGGTLLETPENLTALQSPECMADFLARLEERITDYREEDADFYLLECLDPSGTYVSYIQGMRLLKTVLEGARYNLEPLVKTMAGLKFVQNS